MNKEVIFPVPPNWTPPMADGDSCTLSSWNAVVPDLREPGVLRRVEFTIEMRMRLMPDKVEQQP